jgi:hypothetical protein
LLVSAPQESAILPDLGSLCDLGPKQSCVARRLQVVGPENRCGDALVCAAAAALPRSPVVYRLIISVLAHTRRDLAVINPIRDGRNRASAFSILVEYQHRRQFQRDRLNARGRISLGNIAIYLGRTRASSITEATNNWLRLCVCRRARILVSTYQC